MDELALHFLQIIYALHEMPLAASWHKTLVKIEAWKEHYDSPKYYGLEICCHCKVKTAQTPEHLNDSCTN